MVAEESATNFPSVGNAETAEKHLPSSPVVESGAQIAIAFDSKGNPETVLERPDAHDGRQPKRRQPRWDTRRTAEYLGERGRLPAEALHLITRRTLAEAVAHIRKAVPGADHRWAADYYLRCVELLMPYVHIKQSDLEGASDIGMPSLIAGHFLAAQAFGARTMLPAPGGQGAPLSTRRALVDLNGASVQHQVSGATPEATPMLPVTLPPRGKD